MSFYISLSCSCVLFEQWVNWDLRRWNNCPCQRWTEASLPLQPWFSLPCNSSSIPGRVNNLRQFLEIQILGHRSQRFWSSKFVPVAGNQHLRQTAGIILKQMRGSLPLGTSAPEAAELSAPPRSAPSLGEWAAAPLAERQRAGGLRAELGSESSQLAQASSHHIPTAEKCKALRELCSSPRLSVLQAAQLPWSAKQYVQGQHGKITPLIWKVSELCAHVLPKLEAVRII